MTEEEAKTKACCGNAWRSTGMKLVDRMLDARATYQAPTCAASRCMAWRIISQDAVTGYCGLAGEP